MAVFRAKSLQIGLPPRPPFSATTHRSVASVPQRRGNFAKYEGLRAHGVLSWTEDLGETFPSVVSNGATVFAMRHRRRVKKLGRAADQRKALIRGLVTEILRHGKIKTTTPRAKAIRPFVDKMIGLAKRGDLHARRQALGFIYDKALVKSLFAKVPERYAERSSGFTRVKKEVKHRRGDNAEMSVIELV